MTRTVSWTDVLEDKPAFTTLIWFGTLMALAGGLAQVGVVAWLASPVGPALASLPAVPGLAALIVLRHDSIEIPRNTTPFSEAVWAL